MFPHIMSLLVISGLTAVTFFPTGKTPSDIILRVNILFAKTLSEPNLFKCLKELHETAADVLILGF